MDARTIAPYAEKAIPLHLSSVTGMRYRTLNCVECGHEFLERNADMLYRVGDSLAPHEIHIGRESHVYAMCGNCQQRYVVSVSIAVTYQREGIPLYMQPESLYLSIEPFKKLRNIYCMECGRAFYGISDRISQIVDNRVPFEYVNPSRLGPLEALCHNNNCGQTWALMV